MSEVARTGPRPSIFVRTFSLFTISANLALIGNQQQHMGQRLQALETAFSEQRQAIEHCTGYLGHPFRISACCTRWSKLCCQSMGDASTINTVHSAQILRPHAYFHEGEVPLVFRLLIFIQQRIGLRFHTVLATSDIRTKKGKGRAVIDALLLNGYPK